MFGHFSTLRMKKLIRSHLHSNLILINTHVLAEILLTNGETECYVKHRSGENIGASVLTGKRLNNSKKRLRIKFNALF